MEIKFNEYELVGLSKPLGLYFLNIVREFSTNYLALLEKDCTNGFRIADMGNETQVPVRGRTKYISDCTINRMLFGLDYEAPTIS